MSAVPIETRGLGKQYGRMQAVADVTMTVPEGSICGIVGTNGAGKSTFLNMLLGITRPTTGSAQVLGVDVRDSSGKWRQRLGYVTDQDWFFRQFTVGEMVEYGRRTWKHWDSARCQHLLDSFELAKTQVVRSLSKGMRVQLAFVTALSLRPELFILDEPTSGLDAVVKRQVLQLIVQEAAAGVTTLIATHHLSELERIADRVAFFHKGRVILQSTTEDAKREIRRIQTVFPQGMPDEIRQAPGVLRIEQSGSVYGVIVEHDPEHILALCRRHDPVYLEEMDVDFEELFIHIMHKEGYAREQIILD
ncbi:MAG: ABC transporter ATP-binding protein [Firmicutes bacterium]|nr:ABC transporter ATP-binding protein [Bacillota bacterium]